MTTIYLSNLDTTITAATAAAFSGAVTGTPGVTFGTEVDVSIPLADAKGLFQFTSANDNVNEDDVTGSMTDKSGIVGTDPSGVSNKPDSTSAVTIDYVKELTRLVFGSDLLVDALDNEAAIASDYVNKYTNCITQVLAGGGAADGAITNRTGTNGHGPAAAVAAVKGLLNNETSRKRFELQYNFAPLVTFTAKTGCAAYRKASGASAFSSTALTNFGLDVTMTDANTINAITRGTISDNHSLGTGDTLLIQNQHTGETTTTVLTADTAALLNNTNGTTLTDIFNKANFGYSAVTGGAISVDSGTAAAAGAAATLDITVDARGAVTSITVNGTNAGYGTDSKLQVTSGSKTIEFTVGTTAVLNELRGVTTGANLLEITDAAFTTTGAVAFNGSSGTGAELKLTAASGIPTALAISTAGSGYENASADVSVTLDSKPVVITLDSQEVNAQLNGLSLSSSVRSATAVTAAKGSEFTAGTGLPVTEVTGSAAGNGASAEVTVQMDGATVESVQETTTGTNYDEANRLIVTNFTDGTVISTGTNNANSVQVGMLNGNMSNVNVPFEGSDKILTKISITTPNNQTNTAGETPDAFTQTSLLRISFT